LTIASTDVDSKSADAGKSVKAAPGRMGVGVPRERVDETAETVDTGLEDANEMATKMDEVSNRESHRTREGRDIKVTS
jgi:small subunit ribosomal protein S2